MNWSSQSQIIVQGITESQGTYYAVQMKAYGTNIVAGVSPSNGGKLLEDIPIFDLVEQAITEYGEIDTSLIFVPPYEVMDATLEAIAAGIRRIIIFTSGVPPLDTIDLLKRTKATNTTILGPGSHGIVIPEQTWLGTLHPQFYQAGIVGLISCSKYLSYEVARELNQAEIGQSMVVSLGSDRLIGSDLLQWLSILNADANTKAIVYIPQELNQTTEITTYCRNYGYNKPIVTYVAGLKAPHARYFSDAKTIISNHLSASIPALNQGKQKIAEFKKGGWQIARKPSEIPKLVQQALSATK